MKAELELNIDDKGNPVIKIKHHDRDNSLEQLLLNRFIIEAKQKGIKLVHTSGYLECGTNNSHENYEIRISDKDEKFKIKPIIFDAKEFKQMRLKKDYTLRQVEIITGISNAYLSQLENGKIKKPSYEVVNKLLDLYTKSDMMPPISGGVKI